MNVILNSASSTRSLYLLGYKSEGMVQALSHRTDNCKHRYDKNFNCYQSIFNQPCFGLTSGCQCTES